MAQVLTLNRQVMFPCMSILRNICIAEHLKETFQIFLMSELLYCVPFYCTVTYVL